MRRLIVAVAAATAMFSALSLMPNHAQAAAIPSAAITGVPSTGSLAENVACWTRCGPYGCRRVCNYGYYRPYYRPRYYRYRYY
jgi:hypothetical protein